VDGDIRIAVGKCLRITAFLALLFAGPATVVVMLMGLHPPIALGWIVVWCGGLVLVGTLLYRWGMRAREQQRQASLSAAIERAIRLP
jgi:hypothetical protein